VRLAPVGKTKRRCMRKSRNPARKKAIELERHTAL
jgi:hypothetical protein